MKYYKHKEEPYIVGGVDWRKVIKISGIVLLVGIFLIYNITLYVGAFQRSRNPRIRTADELYEELYHELREYNADILVYGNEATIFLPDGTKAHCIAYTNPRTSSKTVCRIEVTHKIYMEAYTPEIVDSLMKVIEPEFVEETGWFDITYDDVLEICNACDNSLDYSNTGIAVSQSGPTTLLSIGSSLSNDGLIKTIVMELNF